MTPTLQSYIAGRWLGQHAAQTLCSAISGRAVACTHAEAIDFGDRDATAGSINDWAKKKTHGRIERVIAFAFHRRDDGK